MIKILRYDNFKPSSAKSSRALSGSRASDTKCEIMLRSALWRLGLRFRKNVRTLPGKPDIVFPTERLVVFCDGDFWHGNNWKERKRKLQKGANAPYWLSKIKGNIERDKLHNARLLESGWQIIRVWESTILADVESVALGIAETVKTLREAKDVVTPRRPK